MDRNRVKALIDGFSNALRSGAYMDRDRALVGAGIFGAFSFLGLLFMLVTSDGLKDFMGRPLGNDFIVIYAGGRTAIADGAAAIYDVNRIFAQHQAILHEEAPNWGPFLYPPIFIPVAMALARAPYLAAWLGWMALTGAGYLAATRAIAGFRFSFIPILAFSAVCMNLLQGQSGFLIAGLFGGGLLALFARRYLLAGLLLGLLAVKPQLGILIPVALAAAGMWRALVATAVVASMTIIVPTGLFGLEIWEAFGPSAWIARVEVLEKGGIGYFKIISVFAQARMLGGTLLAAYLVQGLATLSAAAVVFKVWRSDASNPLKGAILPIAALLATPYVIEYDLALLAPAVAFLLQDMRRTGFRDYEKTLLVILFVTPALSRMVTAATSVSFALVILAALLFIAWRRARAPHQTAPA